MNINFECDVQVDDVVFTCQYAVTPGQKQTWDDPAIDPEIEIFTICIGEVSVIDIIKDEVTAKILCTLEENVHEDIFDYENDLDDMRNGSMYEH